MDRTAPLRNRRFLVVIGGEGLSMTGDAAFAISLAWLVLQATGSPAALAGVLLAQTIPRGALLLIGGSVTDRLTPRTVMIACHVLRAAAAAVVCALVVAGTWELWHLYALAVVMGAAGAFFTPAADSVLPQLNSPVHYARGNAIQSITEQVSFLIGPLAGGVLTTAYGAGIAIGANAVTFGVAAITCLAIPSLAIPSRHGTSAAPAGLGTHVVEGLRYAWRTHSMRVVLLVVSAATLSYNS